MKSIKNFKIIIKVTLGYILLIIIILILLLITDVFSTIHKITLFFILLIHVATILGLNKISKLKSLKKFKDVKMLKNMLEIETRYCFLCNKPLEISDFYSVNQDLGIIKVAELWNNDYFEFICCDCILKENLEFEKNSF